MVRPSYPSIYNGSVSTCTNISLIAFKLEMIARCPPPTNCSLAQGVMGGHLANSLSAGERVNGGDDCTLPTPSLILEQLCN